MPSFVDISKQHDLELKQREEQAKNDAASKKTNKRRDFFIWFLKILFFPFTLVAYAFRVFTSKIKFKITVKTTLIFTVLFAFVMFVFLWVLISSIQSNLGAGQEEYFKNVWITTMILLAIFTAVIAAVGALASQYMLNPIKKITTQLNDVSSENLSVRIDQTNSQDELKDLTRQLNEMLENLELSFKRGQNFVSDASHELKTPIAVIQGYINLLRRWGKEKPEILEEAIASIARESENMKTITEQMLLLTKLGTFTPNKQNFDVSLVIEEILESYKFGAKQQFDFVPREGFMLYTDKDLYSQVLRVVIENAVKYTPANGKITIVLAATETLTVVDVIDSGIGISAEDMLHIFERFYRCDKARTREKGGSGLGLSIAKSIMDELDGYIEVESEVNKGSKFSVCLPKVTE